MVFYITEIGDAMSTDRIEIVSIHLLEWHFDQTVRRKKFTLFRHTVRHVDETAVIELFYLLLNDFVQILQYWTVFLNNSTRTSFSRKE